MTKDTTGSTYTTHSLDSTYWRLLTVRMELADVRLTDSEREQLRRQRDRLIRELQPNEDT